MPLYEVAKREQIEESSHVNEKERVSASPVTIRTVESQSTRQISPPAMRFLKDGQ
jgi:hypothetical protein